MRIELAVLLFTDVCSEDKKPCQFHLTGIILKKRNQPLLLGFACFFYFYDFTLDLHGHIRGTDLIDLVKMGFVYIPEGIVLEQIFITIYLQF